MSKQTNHEFTDVTVPRRRQPIAHRRVDWPYVALLVGSLSGLWIASGLAIWGGDPSTRFVKLYTASAMIVVVAALGIAIQRLMSAPSSRLHYVFRGGHMLKLGGCLVLVTAVLIGSIVQRGLFGNLFASGSIDARDIADAGFGLAAIVCAVGTGMALLEARETRRCERYWHRSLGIRLG